MDTGGITLLDQQQIRERALHLLCIGELRGALAGEGPRPLSQLRGLQERTALAGSLLIGLGGLQHDGIIYTCRRNSYVHVRESSIWRPSAKPDLAGFLSLARHMHIWLAARAALLMDGRHSVPEANQLAATRALDVLGDAAAVDEIEAVRLFDDLARSLWRAHPRTIDLSVVDGPSVQLTIPARVHQSGEEHVRGERANVPAGETSWIRSHAAVRLVDGRVLLLPPDVDASDFCPGTTVEFERVPRIRGARIEVEITHFESVDDQGDEE